MAQLLYELCFCLWAMSLCEEAKQDFISCGAIPILAEQVSKETKRNRKTFYRINQIRFSKMCN